MSSIAALMLFLVIGCALATPQHYHTNNFQQEGAPINLVSPSPLEHNAPARGFLDSGLVEQPEESGRDEISDGCIASLCG